MVIEKGEGQYNIHLLSQNSNQCKKGIFINLFAIELIVNSLLGRKCMKFGYMQLLNYLNVTTLKLMPCTYVRVQEPNPHPSGQRGGGGLGVSYYSVAAVCAVEL